MCVCVCVCVCVGGGGGGGSSYDPICYLFEGKMKKSQACFQLHVCQFM